MSPIVGPGVCAYFDDRRSRAKGVPRSHRPKPVGTPFVAHHDEMTRLTGLQFILLAILKEAVGLGTPLRCWSEDAHVAGTRTGAGIVGRELCRGYLPQRHSPT